MNTVTQPRNRRTLVCSPVAALGRAGVAYRGSGYNACIPPFYRSGLLPPKKKAEAAAKKESSKKGASKLGAFSPEMITAIAEAASTTAQTTTSIVQQAQAAKEAKRARAKAAKQRRKAKAEAKRAEAEAERQVKREMHSGRSTSSGSRMPSWVLPVVIGVGALGAFLLLHTPPGRTAMQWSPPAAVPPSSPAPLRIQRAA